MRVEYLKRLFRGHRGFALLVAVAVLTILVFSGAALQVNVLDEVWDARQGVARTRARLAVKAGLEAGLLQLEGFLTRGELQQTINGKVREANFQVTMRETTAAQLGSGLAWLPPEKPLVEMSITGVQLPRGGSVTLPGKEMPPEFLRRATALVDPEKVPYSIILWMWE